MSRIRGTSTLVLHLRRGSIQRSEMQELTGSGHWLDISSGKAFDLDLMIIIEVTSSDFIIDQASEHRLTKFPNSESSLSLNLVFHYQA